MARDVNAGAGARVLPPRPRSAPVQTHSAQFVPLLAAADLQRGGDDPRLAGLRPRVEALAGRVPSFLPAARRIAAYLDSHPEEPPLPWEGGYVDAGVQERVLDRAARWEVGMYPADPAQWTVDRFQQDVRDMARHK